MSDGIIKQVVPCACSGTCAVVLVTDIEAWGDEPHHVYVEFYAQMSGGLRSRLRAAWRIVRGKDPWLHAICLEEESVRQMREAFTIGDR